MTSQNQQPQGPSPSDQPSGLPITINSSWTTTQQKNTNSTPPQQATLPEQKGPGWVTPSRPIPAAEYQRATSTAQMTSPPSSPAHEISRPLPVSSPTQTFPPKRHRLRTFFILFLLMLALLVALSAVLGPNLFAKVPGSTSNSSPALGASGPFVKEPLNADQINAIMHLTGYMKYKQLASIYVSHMTLDEELGQLIMVEYADTSYSSDLDTMINKLHAGGVIMYEFQMNTFDQTRHDIAEMQQRASIPLLISTDEEGGPYVHRLSHIYGYRMSATDIYNTGNPQVATQQGIKAAHDLLSLGINENLAPDVDVNLVNGYDMVTRTFGSTTQSVITYAGAYMKALQGNGVIACIKHYPGLGDAIPDAHTTLPVVNRTRDQIYSVELAPFKAFIQSPDSLLNPGMIMPTDVLMPAIDPVYPAELSHIFMTDILRKQFGYDGVVLTDALYMQGITQKWSMYQAAVMALNAGNDMLLGPTGADQMLATINALKAALQNGTLSKARVDEAATRIIALKMEDHLMPALPPQG
ncbi:MAG TPA: glycoside hydrolase family 3 N-terminal domain-containing protein [Ktedonobacteraceae bacterium]